MTEHVVSGCVVCPFLGDNDGDEHRETQEFHCRAVMVWDDRLWLGHHAPPERAPDGCPLRAAPLTISLRTSP